MILVPNNWLYNAGIVGLLRVLQAKGADIEMRISEGGFELHSEDLDKFADAYCKCVLQASIGRFIPSLNQKERELLNSFGTNYQEIRAEHLELLNEAIQPHDEIEKAEENVKVLVSIISDRLTHDIESNFEMQYIELPQSSTKSKAKKGDLDKKRRALGKELDRAKKVVAKVLNTTKSLEKQKYIVDTLKRFYFNKDVIGNYSLAKGRTRVHQLEQKYINPAVRLLNEPDLEERICCKFCGRASVDLSQERLQDVVYNEGMFSISGLPLVFQNFFYNLIPDLFICNVCELVLLCAWAGFNRIPFRLRSGDKDSEYLFVSLPSLTDLWRENESVRRRYARAQTPLKDTIYEDIVSDLFSRERKERSKWVLQNVLFVEIRPVPSKQRDKPTFKYFHVGKDVAKLFIDPSTSRSLSRISGRLAAPGDRQGAYSLQLKREVVKRFLSGDQVYDLTYRVCRQSLETRAVSPKSVVEVVFLHSLRQQIWREYADKHGINSDQNSLRGGSMEPRQVYGLLRGFYSVGASLGQTMELEKRQRLAYRLMSVVRSGKYAEFYDMLMKLYVDFKRPIPTGLLSLLNPNDTIEFESKAYALLSGFLGESQSTTVSSTATAESEEQAQTALSGEREEHE